MIKIIRELVCLPLRLLLLVCRFVPIIDEYTLVKWIWQVGRRVEDGCRLIYMSVQKDGLESGREIAHRLLKETRSAQIVGVIGGLEGQYNSGRIIAVKDWIDLSEELNCKDQHLLMMLKLLCSVVLEEYDREAIVDEMLACNYLPMDDSRSALVEKADILLNNKCWQQAEKIADHLLCVKEDAYARYVKWVVSLQRSDHVQSEIHFAKSKGTELECEHSAMIGQGYLYLDREDEAMEWLYKAVKGGLQWPMQKQSPVGDMLKSQKFAEYCAGRN